MIKDEKSRFHLSTTAELLKYDIYVLFLFLRMILLVVGPFLFFFVGFDFLINLC